MMAIKHEDSGAQLLDATKEKVKAYMKSKGAFKNYDRFLYDHKAMGMKPGNKEKVVYRFENKDMPKYEKDFLSGLLTGLNDSFIFDKLATEWTTNHDGKRKKTGYFMPRMFWDFVKRAY